MTFILVNVFQVYSLLSDVGGQMGLWLGLSICTLFEFLELLSEVSLAVIMWAWIKFGSRHSPRIRNQGSQPTTMNSRTM